MERPPSAEQQAETRELEEGREGENEVGGEEEDGACSDQELDELLNCEHYLHTFILSHTHSH